ncbi:hypothetical protein Tco_1103397 [Tanacetum coccineum]
MTQPPMRIEEELCPINVRFPPNKSNVRIDPKDPQYEPIFDISLEILNNNTIYNALTLTTKVPMIYMQQFWYTYSAKGERKLTFGMPIPKAILRGGIKDSQVYADYVTKYPQAQIAPKLKIGKGLMRKGVIPKPKKKKDAAPKCSISITAEDNVLSDPDEALELKVKNKIMMKVKMIMQIQESNKSNSDEESVESDKFDKDSDNGDDQNEDFMKKHEPLPKSFPTQVPIKNKQAKNLIAKEIKKKNDLKKAIMQRLANIEQQNHADIIEESVQANVLNEVINQLPKLLPKAVSNALKQTLDLKDHKGDKSKKRRKRGVGESLSKKSKDQDEPPHFKRGNDAEEPRQDDEQVHEDHEVHNNLIDVEEESEEHEYKNGSMTYFGKLVKKIFKKDKIIKEYVYGAAFELLKGTCKNSVELKYNIDQ